jgi:hypothetical protein
MKRQILISLLILLAAGGFSTAATLNVPTGSYPTIQAAIDAANDGDEIVVADGSYTGVGNRDLDFGNGLPLGQTRAITVRSANGPANCTIDCQWLGRAFFFHNVEDSNSVVEGFTIQNGSALYGGGIECDFSSPKISNCIIRGNSASDGGGIDCYYASPTIVDCVITGNTASNNGGGVECYEAAPTIVNCLIQDNLAGNYGGAMNCPASSPVISNCTIAENVGVSENSGGVFADYPFSSPIITNCILWGNGDDVALGAGSITYSCIEDADSGTGNISDDPLFKQGPLGDYYLSNYRAGQILDPDGQAVDPNVNPEDANSPCIDAGDPCGTSYVDDANYTTRTDSEPDTNIVDIGYHYQDSGPFVNYQLITGVVVNDPNGTGIINPFHPSPGSPYRQFAEVLLAATPDKISYEVKEWTGADNVPASGEPNNIVTMTGNKTVTVEFEPRIRYWLTTFVVNGVGGSIAPTSSWQYEGEKVALKATPDMGYQILRWTGTDDDSSVDPNNFVTMDANKTVSVEFTAAYVRLDVTVIGNGTITPPRGGTYPLGTVVDLTATPDLHHEVKEWTGTDNDSSTNPNNTVTMTEDKSVTVRFGPIAIYGLTTSVVGGSGTVAPTSPAPLDYDPITGIYTYYDGTTVTITASPDSGWRVLNWYGTNDDSLKTLTNTVVMNSNRAVAVEFEPGSAFGTIWICDPDTGIPYGKKHPDCGHTLSNPYSKIQDAIDDAVSGFPGYEGDPDYDPPLPEILARPGDLILVADGVYKGKGNYDLDFSNNTEDGGMSGHLPTKDCEGGMLGDSKTLTLRSESGPENCIIDCRGAGRGFYFHSPVEDNNCVVEGFTIKNGSADYGGGLSFEGITAPLFDDCSIIDNTADFGGGGAYFEGVDDDDETYTDMCEELQAIADACEADLITDPEDPNYNQDAVDGATALRIWAIMVCDIIDAAGTEDAPLPTITDCKITNNATSKSPETNGGGIHCTANAYPLIISTEISGNSAYKGGGLYSEEGALPSIINCLITESNSVDIGGAMYLYESDAIITLCTIAYNTGLDYTPGVIGGPGPKGGICAREATPVISNCIIGRSGYADPNVDMWGDGFTYGDDLYGCTATYSCIENADDGEGNISQDPWWIRGCLGDFYLRQIQAGGGQDSPCKDAGEENILTDLQSPPPDGYNLAYDMTTSILNHFDVGYADMGYHYPPFDCDIKYRLDVRVVGPGYVQYWDADGHLITVTQGSPAVSYFVPGSGVRLDAHAPAGYWGYWSGTDDDTSFNTWNHVSMYDDKSVTVSFELIEGRTRHVPSEYSTIQAAIDAAKYNDIIELAPAGSDNPYRTSEGFVIRDNKAITIRSKNPDDPCTVAATVIEMEPPISPVGGLTETAFQFHNVGRDTVLEGITIRGFHGSAPDGMDGDDPLEPGENGIGHRGKSIICAGNADPTIRNCVIRDANIWGGDGGDGMPGITSPIMHPNGVEGGWPGGSYGAGLDIIGGSDPLIINCTFDNLHVIGGNGGDGGDGVDFPPGPHGLGGRGGGWYYGVGHAYYNIPWPFAYQGISNGYSSFRGDGSQFYEHYTKYTGLGGAVYVGMACNPVFIDCTFTNNSAEGGLCGISGLDGTPLEWRRQPGLRWKIDSFGGAVYCDEGSHTVFTNCKFSNNYTEPNMPTMDPNLPYDPVTNYDNDDIFVGFGGAVAFRDGAWVRFNDCTFTDNTSDKGGAMYWTHSDPQIRDSNFVGNSAYSGGGALFVDSLAEITGSEFIANEATGEYGRGGAICSLGANALINDCNISDNAASGSGSSGGGVYISSRNLDGGIIPGSGGAIVRVKNSLITENSADRDGGGISTNWASDVQITNCTIADNTVSGTGTESGYGGGLYCDYESDVDVINTIIWGNVAANGSQVAILSGDETYDPRPSAADISYSDIGPRSTYTLLSSAEPFAGGSGGGGGTKLVDDQAIYDQFGAGQERVEVIISLLEPVEMRKETDWESSESVGALRTEIANRQSAVLSSVTSAEFTLRHLYENQTGFSGEVTAGGLDKLLNNALVAYIEPVRYVRVMMAQAIPLGNALEAREIYDGTGITVAIVDTGVDYTHPRLGGGGFPNDKVIGGYDFGNDDADPIPGGIVENTAHGTCCAGIACGSLGTVGDYIGGVAYGAKVYALKVTSDDDPFQGFWNDDTLAAWDWCVTHRNDDPDNPIKVISNSWGMYNNPFNNPEEADAWSPAHAVAADTAVGVGITILAASGNDGFAGQGISWPSAMSNVVSVGAVFDTTDAVTGYSNTADNLDILAPADPLYTTDIVGPNGYDPCDYFPYFNGTSAACPFAAGAVASLQSASLTETGSYLTPAQVRYLLTLSGDPVTDTKVIITKPRVNLGAAINYLASSGPIYVEDSSTLNGWDWNPDTNSWDPNSNSHNIGEDPNFIAGYHLSQIAAGQLYDSPCVDTGSDLSVHLGLDVYTTRTDSFPDTYDPNNPDPNSVIVDMGYHYPLFEVPQFGLTFTAIDVNELDDANQLVIIEPSEPNDNFYNWYTTVGLVVSSPPAGYVVLWSGTDNDDSNGPINTVTMDEDKVVTVTFVKNEYDLTVEVIGQGGTVSPIGTHTYPRGTVVELTAEPEFGYRVERWTGTDNDESTATTNTATMYSNRYVTVEFEEPRTLIVSIGGGQQGTLNNIQDAVNEARDGDTVVVESGTYYGGYLADMIVVDKSIIIRSQYPEDPDCVAATIIDGYMQSQFNEGYNNGAFTFMSGADENTLLNGFTIRNCGGYVGDALDADRTEGHPNGYDGTGWGGPAIRINPGAGPTIKNCVIRDNFMVGGNGSDGAGATATENAGRGGWGGWVHGGAVACLSGSSARFINCQIIDNVARGGNGGDGGDDVDPGGMPNYGGNWSRSQAIDIDPYSLNVTFVEGDLWEIWEADPWLDDYFNIRFDYVGDYRWYSAYGGGVFCGEDSEISFTDCTISGNQTYGGISGQGGAFIVGRFIEPLIPYELPTYGGGVYCAADSNITFTGCTITDNIASEPNWSHHHLDPYLGHGGGVCAEDSAKLIFTDCIIGQQGQGNEASVGGGIHFANANPIIRDCQFKSNEAYQGGGLFGNDGQATIIGCEITDNEAVFNQNIEPNDPNVTFLGYGGGLYIWATEANIVDCNISGNEAGASGGGVYFGGGVPDGEANAPSLTNCLLTNNAAGKSGGGVSVNMSSGLMISNCTIAINRVEGIGFSTRHGGGLYCSDRSNTDIIDSILWGNSAVFGTQIAIDQGPAAVSVSYSDVQGAQTGAFVGYDCTLNWDSNNIYADPCFVTGPLGSYYLSQIDAGQSQDSPCVDAGSDYASRLGMHRYITRTDGVFDVNVVDMGYHYPLPHMVEFCSFCDLFPDGIINFADLEVLLLHWLEDGCSEGNDWCDGTDLTFDTHVDFVDYAVFAGCWSVRDTSAPDPNPSEWKVEPYSASVTAPYSIRMTAETAFDNWGGAIEYYFECVPDGVPNSGWQKDDPNYEDLGLIGDTVYGYRVRTRDERDNVTEWSPVRYAMTGEPGPAGPPSWVLPYIAAPNSIEMQVATFDSNGTDYIQYYFAELSGNPGGSDSAWQNEPNYTDVGLDPNTTYIYRAKALDENGKETNWSSDLFVTTLAAGEEPNDINDVPILQAPVIVEANQVAMGGWWHHVITVRATSEDPLWFKFVCLDDSGFSSVWVERDGAGVITYPPLIPGAPAPTITYGSGIITYDVAIGFSEQHLQWTVCGSNENDHAPAECTAPFIPTPAPM